MEFAESSHFTKILLTPQKNKIRLEKLSLKKRIFSRFILIGVMIDFAPSLL
jgi:hypothetical protein